MSPLHDVVESMDPEIAALQSMQSKEASAVNKQRGNHQRRSWQLLATLAAGASMLVFMVAAVVWRRGGGAGTSNDQQHGWELQVVAADLL